MSDRKSAGVEVRGFICNQCGEPHVRVKLFSPGVEEPWGELDLMPAQAVHMARMLAYQAGQAEAMRAAAPPAPGKPVN